MRRWKIAGVAMLLVVSCINVPEIPAPIDRGGGEVAQDLPDEVPEVAEVAEVVEEVRDVAAEATDVADVVDLPGDLRDAQEDAEVMQGGFGAPCTGSSDCLSGHCIDGLEGSLCTQVCTTDCPEGWECLAYRVGTDTVSLCAPKGPVPCGACVEDSECVGGLCLELAEGKFCGRSCEAGACPAGYTCETMTIGRSQAQQCRPANGTCSCNATTNGSKRACTRQNAFGTCAGEETCDVALGWVNCTAREPAAETCNGIDDDCTGGTDISATPLCDDENVCTTDSCNGQAGCGHVEVSCNDQDACTDDTCDPVSGCQHAPKDCDDADPCTVDDCDPAVTGCFHQPFDCSDGNVCTGIETCLTGVGCQDAVDLVCNDGDVCTDDSCDPLTGCKATNNTATCRAAKCQGGVHYAVATCGGGTCPAQVQTSCDDGNPCTEDTCDPATGCAHPPFVGACPGVNPGCDGTCVGTTCVQPVEILNGLDDDCDGRVDETFDLDHDGVCDDPSCAVQAEDHCPTVWTPDNAAASAMCPPADTLAGWTMSRPLALSQAGAASTWRRTNEPVEIPLVNGILDDSVVGYWKLDGGMARDWSGGGHDGSVTGAIASEGAFGDESGAADFNGASDGILIPPMDVPQSVTLMAWVRPEAQPTSGCSATSQYDIAGMYKEGSGAYLLHYSRGPGPCSLPTRIVPHVWSGTSWQIDEYEYSLPLATWSHVAMTYNSAHRVLQLFVDGRLVHAKMEVLPPSGSHDVAGSKVTIGKSYNDYNYFNGAIDEVVVFQRPLTPDEIAAYYNSRRPYGTSLVPTAQPDFDDLRVTETSPQQADHLVPSEVVGVKPHSDTPCTMGADDGTWKDRDDLCGVVGYWKLDGDGKDASGSGRNGTLTGTTSARGRFGNPGSALSFDGAASVTVAPSQAFSFDPTTQSYTVETWVETDSMPTHGMHAVIDRTSGDSPIGLNVGYDTDTSGFFVQAWDGTQAINCKGSSPIQPRRWFHLAGVFEAGKATLFVNGQKECSASASINSITSIRGLTFGSDPANPSPWVGKIDEILIHSVAKSAEYLYRRAHPGLPTVRFLAHTKPFASGAGTFDFLPYALHWGNPAAAAAPAILTGLDQATKSLGLLSPALGYAGWWRFNEGSGTVAADSSTWKRAGAVSGGSAWVQGPEGTALRFDGVDDYVSMGGIDPLGGLTAATVEVFARPNVLEPDLDGTNVVVGKAPQATTPPNQFWIAFKDSSGGSAAPDSLDGRVYANDETSGSTGIVPVAAPTDYPVAMVFDSTSGQTLYLGGLARSSGPALGAPIGPSSSELTVARRSNLGDPCIAQNCGYWMNGIVDSVRLTSRALAPDEFLHYPMASWDPGICSVGGAMDSDCDGTVDADDCDPGDATIHPGAEEFLDGIDQDCDGFIDETYDLDHDGVCDDPSCAEAAVDACPTVWTPDNAAATAMCGPAATMAGWTMSRPLALSQAGAASTWRRTNEPVEVPLVNGIMDDSVVGYWKLDGGSARDWSGNGRDGVLHGTTKAQGVFGADSGLNFNGTSDYIEIPDNPALNFGTGPVSVLLWVKTSVIPDGSWHALWTKHNSANWHDKEYGLNLIAPTCYPEAFLSDGAGGFERAIGSKSICDGQWHQLGLVRTGPQLQLWLDGKLVATTAATINPTNTNAVNIGRNYYNGGHGYFEGSMDEVILFNRALAPDEVAAYFTSGLPFATSLVPTAQADFDDVRVTETSPQQADHMVPSEVVGVKPHSDTPCPMGADDGTWKDRDDLCGVVGYWKLDGDGKDAAGSGHDGTIAGSQSPRGRFGDEEGALKFEGATSTVDILNADSGCTARTAETWLKLDPVPSQGGYVVLGGNLLLGQSSSALDKVTCSFSANTTSVVSQKSVRDGNWHHVACVSANGTTSVYVDGLPDGSVADPVGPCSWNHVYLNHNPASTNDIHGTLDEVILHSVAKSPEYIYRRAHPGVPTVRFLAHTKPFANAATTYDFLDYALRWGNAAATAAPAILTGQDQVTKSFGLLSPALGYAGWWRFNEGAGTVAVDASTRKGNGVLTGAPAWSAGSDVAALTFDGVDDKVQTPLLLNLPARSSLTGEAVVSPAASGRALIVLEADDSGCSDWIDILRISDASKAGFAIQDESSCSPSKQIWSTTSVPVNVATPIASVLDGSAGVASTFISYREDGRMIDPGLIDQPLEALDLGVQIGSDEGTVRWFQGTIDSVRLMSRALTPDEFLHYPMAAWDPGICSVGGAMDSDCDGDPDATDCGPAVPGVHHGALELCNGVDDDCDGETDEASGMCDDGVVCTIDRCVLGLCTHDVADGFCLVGGECTGPSGLLYDDFAGDLSKWTLWGSPLPVIDTGDGQPLPSFRSNGDSSYDSGAVSLASFDFSDGMVLSYDLKTVTLSANFQDAEAALGSKTAYTSSEGVSGGAGVHASRSDGKRGFWMNSGKAGAESWTEEDSLGWHHYDIRVRRSDNRLEFWRDGELAYASMNPLDPAFQGLPVALGKRGGALIDNVLVNRSCASGETFTGTIVYSSLNTPRTLYLANSDGTGSRRITNDMSDATWPLLSPDGRKLAYFSKSFNNEWHIFVMDAAGRESRRITTSVQDPWYGLAWSPDGSQLAHGAADGKLY